MNKIYYPSKKDWWLRIMLLGIVIPIAIYDLITEEPLLIKIINLIVVIFILWIWFDTGYTITSDNNLLINIGPLRSKVDINKIIKVKKSRNILSSPALSLDRLKIISNNNVWLISPKKKTEFINELRKRNLTIEFII